MDVSKLLLATLFGISSVSAWYDVFYDNTYPELGFRSSYNITAARQHINASASVPFSAGTLEPWNFTVSLAEIPAQGENATKVADARVLLTLYDVQPPKNWTGEQSSGPTKPMQSAQDPNAPLNFEFTWRTTYWPFSVAATNAYSGDGDCAGVVDPTCLGQLRALNESSAVAPLDTPACENVTARWGGAAASRIVQRSSLDDTWTWQLGGYISGVYSAGDRTLFERERQRVHLAALSGNDTHVLCARIDNDQVKAGDPGAGPVPNGSAGLLRAAMWTSMVSTVVVFLL